MPGDEEGNELPANQVGEILIRGPSVTPGYWNDPEATAAAFVDGWFRTGDAGRMDIDGAIYIVDRYKDMYISGGENVYPAEVENVLLGHDAILRAAVIGVEDAKWGEVGLAAICVRSGGVLDPEELKAWCGERLSSYKVPTHVHLVPDLPMSPQGKVLKQVLRQTLEPGKAASRAAEALSEPPRST